MIYPSENKNNPFYPNSEKEIILEIELNGKIRFDFLLYTVYKHFGIIYKIISAELEYINGNNFGNVRLLLKVDNDSLSELENYLHKNRLVNSKIEVLQKREAI